jgi:hypothetical protein
MSTLRDMVNAAGRSIGIVQQNEVLTGENMTVALYALTNFVDTCSNNKLLVYSVTPYVFPIAPNQETGSQQSYTLGLGGDWNIPRPMKIEAAYARLQPGNAQELDIQMQPLTYAQYASIAVKNTPSTWPFSYYDDNMYPLRTVTLFPVPTGPASIVLWLREPLIDLQLNAIAALGPITGGTLYTPSTGSQTYYNVKLGGGTGTGALANIIVTAGTITECILVNAGTGYAVNDALNVSPSSVGGTGSGFSVTVLAVSASLDDPINFPPGYERFFRYGLALELVEEFGKKVEGLSLLQAKFEQAKLELETLNSTPVFTRGDGGMSRNGRNRYFNWITGNFWSFGNN